MSPNLGATFSDEIAPRAVLGVQPTHNHGAALGNTRWVARPAKFCAPRVHPNVHAAPCDPNPQIHHAARMGEAKWSAPYEPNATRSRVSLCASRVKGQRSGRRDSIASVSHVQGRSERTTSASPSLADSHSSAGNATMLAAYARPRPRSSPFLSPSPAHHNNERISAPSLVAACTAFRPQCRLKTGERQAFLSAERTPIIDQTRERDEREGDDERPRGREQQSVESRQQVDVYLRRMTHTLALLDEAKGEARSVPPLAAREIIATHGRADVARDVLGLLEEERPQERRERAD